MKKLVFFFLLLSLTVPKVSAQTIQTGDASAKSEVRTEVNGNSRVNTKIEVEANGEKKIIESSTPGTLKVEVNTGPASSSAGSELDTQASKAASEAASDNEKIIQKLLSGISDFLKKVFSIFF